MANDDNDVEGDGATSDDDGDGAMGDDEDDDGDGAMSDGRQSQPRFAQIASRSGR
jgi:hypothetical protein